MNTKTMMAGAAALVATACFGTGSEQVEAALGPYVARGEIAGVVSVLSDADYNETWDCFGWADAENKVPMRPDTVFAVFSMSKTFAGCAMMIAIDRGILTLDDPVEKYLPEFKDVKNKITIRDCMCHMTGIVGGNTPCNHCSTPVREQARNFATNGVCNRKVGEKFSYGNASLNTASACLEVASGVPYGEFVRKNILEPLGMKDTAFDPTESMIRRMVKAYSTKGGPFRPANDYCVPQIVFPCDHKIEPMAAAGLYSTPRDMIRFSQMLAHHGEWKGVRIVSRKTFDTIWAVKQTPAHVPEPYTVGAWLYGDWFGHEGAMRTDQRANLKTGHSRVFFIQTENAAGKAFFDAKRDWNAACDAFQKMDKPFSEEMVTTVENDRNPDKSYARAQRPGEKRILGYQLDISRCKVPTMETLYRMVDVLAKLGYNQFQLYTEHTFAYAKHEVVWREASPMTPDEIRALDAYCASRGVELVPNQNSFGHLEHWLKHPEYNDLAEAPLGGTTIGKWYTLRFPGCINPTDPRSEQFVAGLYDELFPCFRSKYVNVGGDETVELKDTHEPRIGKSAAAIAKDGAARVYLSFLKKIHAQCASRGHTMMFWGDIILEKPELIPELPEDAVCLNWGYEAGHPFEKQTASFEAANRRFVVCPGTSAWGTLSGRTSNMMGNITNAFGAAERHGAMGAMIADWGDGGHPNPWVVSVPALVFASYRAKGMTLTREALAAEIDKLLGARCGAALLAYGDIYEKVRGRMGNSAELYTLLEEGSEYKRGEGVTDETLKAGLDYQKFAKSLADLSTAPEWVREDFAMLDLLYRAVADRIAAPGRRNFRAQFEPEYRRLWLKQNRVGGLAESLNWVFGFVR